MHQGVDRVKILQEFVQEYHEHYDAKEILDDSITSQIKKVQNILLDDKFHPSIQLKELFNKLLRRATYPMEVAIVGQFSSGKSTFLNALLAKDILPTGITPVTSKVNFINYGEEYKLKVSYKNGAQEYHSLDRISSFTDQRGDLEDIKYLTLYAPMDILKDISFVDTPGLNSLSDSDTHITKKILRDVDGIIWLTLIDNAGKESEAEVLNKYLQNFENRSLCVLNQKDKFSASQVTQTLEYMQSKFGTFFDKVVPISAKMALDSRVNQKDVLIESEIYELQNAFNKKISSFVNAKDLNFFQDEFENFTKSIEKIEQKDSSDDMKMMQESNIKEVLDFIDNSIRPSAKTSKEYALQKDLSSICDILTKEYETIVAIYESLENILRSDEAKVLKAFDAVYIKHSQTLFVTHDKIETIIQTIAETIFKNIKTKNDTRYVKEKTLFDKNHINSIDFESYYLDVEATLQELFYENQYVDKQIKAIISYFKNIELDVSEEFRDVFRIVKKDVQEWQEPYELIRKHREIASDIEFANIRQYVSKVYENILLDYHRAILGNIAALHKNFAYFDGALGFSYKQMTQKAMLEVHSKMMHEREMYKKDSENYSIHLMSIDMIVDGVKTSFNFEKITQFLTSRRNYLYKIVESSKEQFLEINHTQINSVLKEKHLIENKIKSISSIAL